MKQIFNQYICTFCLLIFTVFFTSCEDTMLNNMVDDRVFLLKPGLNEVKVYNFERPVAEVMVMKSGVGQRTSSLKIAVNPEVLKQYNEAKGTNFKLLNSSTYSLVNSTLEFGKNEYQMTFQFVIDDEKMAAEQAKDPDAVFVIPCEVTNLNPGKGDSVKMQTLLLPRMTEPYIYLSKSGFLTEINTITSKSDERLYFNNKIEINYPASADIGYTLAIPKNSEDLVTQYNTLNGTDYVMLPGAALELTGAGKILKGVNYGDFKFQILKTKLTGGNNAPKYGKYLLPLKIEQVSENKIHPEKNIVLIPFSYHE